MEKVFSEKWNLDNLFKGGSDSLQLVELLEQMQNDIRELDRYIHSVSSASGHPLEKTIEQIIRNLGRIQLSVSQVTSFTTCLLAENSKNKKAMALQGETASVKAAYNNVLHRFKQFLATIEKTNWTALLNTESLTHYQLILSEWRDEAASPLSSETEDMISNLMFDGYHAWGDLYRSIMNNLRVPIEIQGSQKDYSIGQATNLRTDADKDVREKAFTALEKTWTDQEQTMARILNHITGFRLLTDKSRGTLSGLENPLKDNRIKEETLRAMWQVVTRHKQPFVDYLAVKAKLSGHEKMPSYDFWAPFQKNNHSTDYIEAVEFILNQFHQFGPVLENFARSAFAEGWIEASEEPEKAAYAFCAGFPLSNESRVFLTYDGTMCIW